MVDPRHAAEVEGASELWISYSDALGFVLRGALVAFALMAIAVPITYTSTLRQPAQFRAVATLLVPVGPQRLALFDAAPFAPSALDLGAYRVAVVSDSVLAAALRALGVDEPTATDTAALRAALSTSIRVGRRDSSLLRVEATGPTPRAAIERADAATMALLDWDQDRTRAVVGRVIASLEGQLEVLDAQLRVPDLVGTDLVEADLETHVAGVARLRSQRLLQLANARTWSASIGGALHVLEGPEATVVRTAPRPLLQGMVAALLATALAYGALLARASLGTRLGRSDMAAGLPVLAELPTSRGSGDPRLSEVATCLRAELVAATPDDRPRVILVTSALAGEGKSTVARLLAESFVRTGSRTLLVDADLRSPVQASALVVGGLRGGPTTVSWLRDSEAQDSPGWVVLPGGGRLHVVLQPRPVANAVDVVARGIRSALSRWSDFEVVVFDAPAVWAASDPLAIAPHCSGTLLVIDPRCSDLRAVEEAIAALRRSGARIFGSVANRVALRGRFAAALGRSPAAGQMRAPGHQRESAS